MNLEGPLLFFIIFFAKIIEVSISTVRIVFINKGENLKEKIKEMPLTKPFAKGDLEKIIAQVFKRYKTTDTSIFLDKLKDLGFKYSTKAGITIAISDIVTSKEKGEILKEGRETVDKINKQFGDQ